MSKSPGEPPVPEPVTVGIRRSVPDSTGSGTFRSLRKYNYRLWFGGGLISNIGTWMQRTAQDWLVLTELTHHSATAVGVVMGLQFGPQLLLLPWAGYAADRFDRRRLLMVTQAAMGVLSLALGLLVVAGLAHLWQVYIFAFLSGCVTAIDGPSRQTFVADLVGEEHLANAVALNSTSMNSALLAGPSIAGIVIAAVGSGWAILINGASFIAVLGSLFLLRQSELHPNVRAGPARGSLLEGLRYVRSRPDIGAILWMIALIGTFGLNFPIFISTMATRVFHGGASLYGLLYSVMALGTIAGALVAARRKKPNFRLIPVAAATFGIGFVLAAMTPNAWLFGAALVLIGIATLTFSNATSSLMQLSTPPVMRGRVMALRLAIGVGGTPIGAPIAGWVADSFGPRWALGVGAAAGFAATAVAIRYRTRPR